MPKKTRRSLRGGAVPYLDPTKFKYNTYQDMVDNMSMYTISAHGETTPDKRFLVVPPQTYLVFTAHSGDPAISGIEGANPYLLYKKDETKTQFYEKIYKQLFSPIATRKAANIPQLKEDLYIYEPGDVIPDYNLFFLNTSKFVFMHGIYKLPIESISGPDAKRHSDHYGKTKYVIRTLIDDGTLTPDMLNDIDERDKEDILTTSKEELEKGTAVYDGIKLRRSFAMNEIEKMCCQTQEENLLYKSPFDSKLIQKQQNVVRLSYVLKTLPPEIGKKRRFFFLHFCRVSFDAHLTRLKTLFRTISYSGKCPSMEERETGFNIFRLAILFCKLPPKVKSEILKTAEGQSFLNILTKSIQTPPGLESWSTCVPSKFLVEPYAGYLDEYDFINIEKISVILSKLLTEYTRVLAYIKTIIRDTKQNEERTLAIQKQSEQQEARSALIALFKPIKQFHQMYSRKYNETFAEQEERSILMEEIYKIIQRKLYPIRLNTENDPLHLWTSAIWLLKIFHETLQTSKYDQDFNEIKDELDKMNEYYQDDIVQQLEVKFSIYMGDPPIGNRVMNLPFLSKNNVNELVTVQTNENLGLNGGRRNQTRRHKLISK